MRHPLRAVLTALGILLSLLSFAPGAHARGSWQSGYRLTEYYPVPEAWFIGKRVSAPGIPGRHRIDWLYGASGVSMEGDGVGVDGRRYHLEDPGRGGWIDDRGDPALTGRAGERAPYWRAGAYWRTRSGRPTFPLEGGAWDHGVGVRYVPLPGVRFATGPSRPLVYWRSIAVDPRVIPLGSTVYIPRYRGKPGGGCFKAVDVGGAIRGRHIDVFRPAPAEQGDARSSSGARVYVARPGRSNPHCSRSLR